MQPPKQAVIAAGEVKALRTTNVSRWALQQL
jgi:hypothetical protein